MIADRGAQRVVVGIDGSEQSLAAAEWGAQEAVRHDVTLTLLYVIDRNRTSGGDVFDAEQQLAEAVLCDANAVVEAIQKPVKVECDIVCGDPGTVLFTESRSAALLCLGAPKAAPHGPSDSLALDIAASACCTVAVVPSKCCSAWTSSGRLVVFLDLANVNYDALQTAMEQAELQGFSLDVVTTTAAGPAAEELLIRWSQRSPDIGVRIVESDDLLRYVAEQHGSVRSVVLGAEHHREVTHLIELTRARPAYYGNPAVLVVRSRHL
jgi:nucleotide-binding universal stress UspA family protein